MFRQFVDENQFNVSEWAQFLHISERTIQRLSKENRSFDMHQSERIIQIMILHHLGVEVFGSSEKFNTWMRTENPALGKIMPKQLLDSAFGIDMVKDELLRIEHGVLA
jgi:putative toxin-antitoxin system antitoxin component (TIGR02293 family)